MGALCHKVAELCHKSCIDRPHNEDTRVSSAAGLVEVCISFPLSQLLGFGFNYKFTNHCLMWAAISELCETQDCRSLFQSEVAFRNVSASGTTMPAMWIQQRTWQFSSFWFRLPIVDWASVEWMFSLIRCFWRKILHVLFGLDLAIFGSICVAELRMSVGFSTLMCSEMAWNLEKPDVEKKKFTWRSYPTIKISSRQ